MWSLIIGGGAPENFSGPLFLAFVRFFMALFLLCVVNLLQFQYVDLLLQFLLDQVLLNYVSKNAAEA